VKILVLSMDAVGEGLAFALRCAKAGHDVRLWLHKGANPDIGKGFKQISLVDQWLSSVKWAEMILPTGNHLYLPKLEHLRSLGIKVFGPSEKSARLEVKRAFGMEFFKTHGIEVPPYKEFANLQDAAAHVRQTEGRYVFKTLGDEDDKSLSYVSRSPADMVARIERWQRLGLNPGGKVMLQEVIEGVEIGVSRWMGTKGFIGPYNENFEHKKLLSGNCGPNCGEAGTVQKYCDTSALGDQVLGPLEESLVKMGHLGDIDVNCIVDEKGKAWPLEFTCRLGWPAFNIQIHTHQGDPVQWMLDACNGKDSLKVLKKIACGVVLAQPDYPYSGKTQAEVTDIPIYGVTRENEQYLYPQAVKRQAMPDMQGGKIVNREIWASAGDYLMVVTGTGKSVRQAATRAYDTVGEIKVPDMIYRDDIGEKLEEEIPKLQMHGFAAEFHYE
jgi:phosphoribosylamine---glycine ligase